MLANLGNRAVARYNHLVTMEPSLRFLLVRITFVADISTLDWLVKKIAIFAE